MTDDLHARQGPDFETLSAYVDGELDPAWAADIADLAARDPAVARRVAKLHALRAAVGGMTADVVVLPTPAVGRRSRSSGRRTWLPLSPWRGAAAALLLLAGLSGIAWGVSDRFGGAAGKDWIAVAIDRHDAWSDRPTGPVGAVGFDGGRHDVLLALAGLTPAHRDAWLARDGREVLHTGYVGRRGCRLSLFRISHPTDETVVAAVTPSADLDMTLSSALLQSRWQTGQAIYVLLARDMDDGRFTVLSQALREATARRDAPDAAMMADLETARQPCRA